MVAIFPSWTHFLRQVQETISETLFLQVGYIVGKSVDLTISLRDGWYGKDGACLRGPGILIFLGMARLKRTQNSFQGGGKVLLEDVLFCL